MDDGISIWLWQKCFWVYVQASNGFFLVGSISSSFILNYFDHQSEGTSLTQNDEKGYWGVISEVEGGENGSHDSLPSRPSNKKIEIAGAVMVGWGLEPCSVGRFKMIEIEELLEDDDEEDGEEEEEDYVEMSADAVVENASNLDSILSDARSDDSSNQFDFPGAFE